MDTVIVRNTRIADLKKTFYPFIFVMLVIQGFCIYTFLPGTTVLGQTIGLSNLLNLLPFVFSSGISWYTRLTIAFVCIAFLFVLIRMGKNIISSFSLIRMIVRKDAVFISDTSDAILTFGGQTGESCMLAISFVLVCNLFDETFFASSTYILAALWVFVVLVTRVIYSLFDRYTRESVLLKLVCDFISASALILLLLFAKFPAIDRLVSTLGLLLDSLSHISINFVYALANFLTALIYLAITVLGIIMMHNAAFAIDVRTYGNSDFRYHCKKILIGSVLLGAISVAVYAFRNSPVKFDLACIIHLFKPYLSLIFLSAAAFISTELPEEFETHPKEGLNADKCTVNKYGILRINNDITEIASYAFAYRTDITRIYIPANIAVIGENAFFGCSSVTEIYCDHYAAAPGWSSSWKKSCEGVVYWKEPDRKENNPATDTPPQTGDDSAS